MSAPQLVRVEATREEYWEHHALAWEAAGYPQYAASCRAQKEGLKGRRSSYTLWLESGEA